MKRLSSLVMATSLGLIGPLVGCDDWVAPLLIEAHDVILVGAGSIQVPTSAAPVVGRPLVLVVDLGLVPTRLEAPAPAAGPPAAPLLFDMLHGTRPALLDALLGAPRGLLRPRGRKLANIIDSWLSSSRARSASRSIIS